VQVHGADAAGAADLGEEGDMELEGGDEDEAVAAGE